MDTYERARWRVLNTGHLPGQMNMAVDEAIMLSVLEGKSPPTLRFYGWVPFCLSIGYAQSMAKEVDLDAVRSAGFDYVRRPTGGRAILHGDELTYSVLAPQTEPRVAGSIVESYRRLSLGLVEGLHLLGVQALQSDALTRKLEEKSAACFDAPSHYEITVNGRKLVGSAQMRRKGMVLQHGSLPLCGDITRIIDYLRMPDEDTRRRLRADLRGRATTLAEALGRAAPFDEVAAALAEGFARRLNLELTTGELTAREHQLAEELYRDKYHTDEWNFLR
jgi:lipoate-protein ligase A